MRCGAEAERHPAHIRQRLLQQQGEGVFAYRFLSHDCL